MNVIGLGAEEQKSVFRLVSAVLHLGNIRFADQGGKAKVENREGNLLLRRTTFPLSRVWCVWRVWAFIGAVADVAFSPPSQSWTLSPSCCSRTRGSSSTP